ncbi:MAG: MFS transporter [Proteobacteria bacterium]|nr:MFS transporter [Pseudomonadota bacterium]
MQQQPKSKIASLAVIYLTVFIDLLGFGIILPLLPFYAVQFGASGLWVGILGTAYSAAQFAGAPIIGRLSDKYGRRPVLIAALFGSVVSLTIAGFATNLYLLITARALAGLFGGSIAAAQAYVADVTTPAERSKYMGLLGASIGMGFVFGPAIGASLSGFGFGTAALVAAAIAAVNLVAALFLLKESRTVSGAESRRAFAFAGLRHALQNDAIRSVLAATFLCTLAFVAMETTYALLGSRRFGLTPHALGYVFTYIGIVVVIVQGGLIGRVVKIWGERRVAMVGAVIMMSGLIAVAMAPTLTWSIASLGLLSAGQAFTSPTLATMLSRCANRDEQGGVLGLSQSLAAAARGIMPVMAGWLFDFHAALPYLVGATVCFLAAGIIGAAGSAGLVVKPEQGAAKIG